MTLYRHPVFSFFLVGLQFGSLLWLMLIFLTKHTSLSPLLYTLPGILIGLKAIHDMHLHNLHILPDPSPHAQLIQSGLYRWIRHPMYLAVLLFSLPFAIHIQDFLSITIWLILLFTLLLKLHYEETLLKEKFSTYSLYQTHTKKLIPFIL